MSDDENRIVVGNPETMRLFYPKPRPQVKPNIAKRVKPTRLFGFSIPKIKPPKTGHLGPVSLKSTTKNSRRETTVSVRMDVGPLNRPFIYGFVCVVIGLSCLTLLAFWGVFDPIFRFWGI